MSKARLFYWRINTWKCVLRVIIDCSKTMSQQTKYYTNLIMITIFIFINFAHQSLSNKY